MMVTFAPMLKLKSAQMCNEAWSEAFPGGSVGFNVNNIPVKDVHCCNVAGDNKSNPAIEAAGFMAQGFILNHSGQISAGYTPVLDFHTVDTVSKYAEMKEKTDLSL